MSRRGRARGPRDRGFPRVSGDEPPLRMYERMVAGFSPRERG